MLEYRSRSARVILYRVVRPRRQAFLFKYLYRHHRDECTYYVTATAIASRIASKIAPQGSVIDVQEGHLALALYMLPKGVRRRFITHTPGPWGHSRLCREEAEKVYAVSCRHAEITRKLSPGMLVVRVR